MKIALLGDGRMGSAVASEAADAGHDVVALLGLEALGGGTESVAASLADADVAIDFTVAEQVARSVAAAAQARVDLVIGTTGWRPEEVALDTVASAGRGVVYGANFSLGVHVFMRLIREAGRLVDAVGDYDVHVEEAHHRHKVDHPSGTAIRVAEALLDEIEGKARWAPAPPDGAADAATLYVSSVRAGEVAGTHLVGIEGPHDRIAIRHEALGRTGFARGAVRAAEWVHGRTGVFTFEQTVTDLLEERRNARSEG